MRSRNEKVDIIKGFAILLVVIGHAIQFNFADGQNNVIYNIIYSFHMPLFMCISGIVAQMSTTVKNCRDLATQTKKKFIGLLVPFISWYYIVNYILLQRFTDIGFVEYTNALIRNPDRGLWFLWILFCLYIINGLISVKFNSSNTLHSRHLTRLFIILTICLLFLLGVKCFKVEILGARLLAWHMPFFLLGYYIYENRNILYKWQKWYSYVITISYILYPISLVFYSYKSDLSLTILNNLNWSNKEYIGIVYRYIVAFLGIVFFSSLVVSISSKRIKSMLKMLGKYTMEIYAIHYYFIDITGGILLSGNFTLYNILMIGIAVIFSLILSLVISHGLIRKNSILSILFLGRSDQKNSDANLINDDNCKY